jgi:transposase
MDNLGSHKSSAVRRALRAAGAKLFFLPKYSPDLNPIEMLFSKLKHGLRKAARRTDMSWPSTTPSSTFFPPSPRPNVQTTALKLDMLEPRIIPL